MIKRLLSMAAIATLVATGSSCKKDGDDPDCEIININFFSIDDDKALGAQTAHQIDSLSSEYPVLNPATHQAAYAYLNAMRDKILATGTVEHASDFAWQLKIINDDNTLNAFCTPGGYIYVYTGIIKYLDRGDDLAGVLGHEMGHAAKRHTTRSMTTQYGASTLISLLAGNNPGLVTQIATQLATLKYSRCHESEADAASVDYLKNTTYNCAGAATFFTKLQESGQSGGPVFLSTHPDPGNRVTNITARANNNGCVRSETGTDTEYQNFKNSL